MNKRKGFTLVELLAVIVILAIIMIIAIPSVLSTMKSARQKSFIEYVQKIRTLGEQTFMSDELNGVTLDTCMIYDITKDLDLDSLGSYKGYLLVVKDNNDIKYYQTLYDDNYMVYGVVYDNNLTTSSLLDYSDSAKSNQLSAEYLAAVGGCSSYTDRSSGSSNSVSITGAVSSTIAKNSKTLTSTNGLWTATYICKDGKGVITSCSYKDGTICNGGYSNRSNTYMCTLGSTANNNLYYDCNTSLGDKTYGYGGGMDTTITC